MKTKYIYVLISLLVISTTVFADGLPTQPGDPGMSTPVDGGILMAILGLGGLAAMLFKKKKDK
ncbi:MAG: hypothetical protein PHH37_12770 [Paludibacter sp.]|nr:hypothetical protein [Paludibacter sp.]